MRHFALTLPVLLATLFATAGSDSRCDVRRDLSGALPSDGLTGVLVAAESGGLEVVGVAGDEIRVSGVVCASDGELADDAELVVERRRDAAWIESRLPDARGGWRNTYARMDLRIEMPEGLAADIEDGSGATEVDGIAGVRIDDGSGGIRVSNVGEVVIDDGSGEIDLERIGSVEIEDGSGEIDVRDVTGDVHILDDSSGSIDIYGVTGSVLIDEDSSGSIRVERVGGDFTLRRDGSGSVRYRDVEGRVSLPPRR